MIELTNRARVSILVIQNQAMKLFLVEKQVKLIIFGLWQNNVLVNCALFHKHLGLMLNSKSMMSKFNKTIVLL